MLRQKYVCIGRFIKPVGTTGEIKTEIDDQYWDDFVNTEHFFVRERGNYVPLFIEDVRESNYLLVKVEDIESPEQAASLGQKDIFLREKDLTSDTSRKTMEKQGLEGYHLYNNGIAVGVIEAIEQHPGQILAIIVYQNQKKHIPLVDPLILEIDPKSGIINMDLPEGLLEI